MHGYRLEKQLWTDADFDVMGWHDATLWSMVADPGAFDLSLDLDYIFSWVHPSKDARNLKFWVAPVTMVFENAHTIEVNLASQQGQIDIAQLYREKPSPTPNGAFIEHIYRFECQEGEIKFRATGFNMFVRRHPSLISAQCFSLQERGGVSFTRGLWPL